MTLLYIIYNAQVINSVTVIQLSNTCVSVMDITY